MEVLDSVGRIQTRYHSYPVCDSSKLFELQVATAFPPCQRFALSRAHRSTSLWRWVTLLKHLQRGDDVFQPLPLCVSALPKKVVGPWRLERLNFSSPGEDHIRECGHLGLDDAYPVSVRGRRRAGIRMAYGNGCDRIDHEAQARAAGKARNVLQTRISLLQLDPIPPRLGSVREYLTDDPEAKMRAGIPIGSREITRSNRGA
jgi:hypothetical protein